MNKKGIRFTAKERQWKREEAAKAYSQGATIAQTAARVGCSPATASNLLHEAGVTMHFPSRSAAPLPEGLLTAKQAAALIGIGHSSLNVLRHRGNGPPAAERPPGAHGNYTYYWRAEVERWLSDRAERGLQRRREAVKRRAKGQLEQTRSVFNYELDWPALMRAVDSRRRAEDLTWGSVCRGAGVDPGHMSRIRNGYEPASGLGTFARLAFWACDTLPDEVKRFTRPAKPSANS
jgi:hypothetical protein